MRHIPPAPSRLSDQGAQYGDAGAPAGESGKDGSGQWAAAEEGKTPAHAADEQRCQEHHRGVHRKERRLLR
ncbi:hypothetical protein GCM10010321_34070 [Streptomyces chartreusis]|nr:hypothetical protein GCM10010321_34070 [Streptomyces chartreusis]